MLPHVETQNRNLIIHQRAVLVRLAADFELAIADGEPPPPAAKLRRCRGAEQLLELCESSERPLDSLREVAAWLAATAFCGRCHDRPEQRVVVVPATIVAYRGADVLGHAVDAAEEVFQVFLAGLGLFGDGAVQFV